jgi:hypothetical protein
MVPPERETPGMRASDWAKPYTRACGRLRCLTSVSLLRAVWSANQRMSPKTISVVPTRRRSRKGDSIWSFSSRPSTPMGMLPTMTYQPMRAACRERRAGVYRERVQVEMISQISRLK